MKKIVLAFLITASVLLGTGFAMALTEPDRPKMEEPSSSDDVVADEPDTSTPEVNDDEQDEDEVSSDEKSSDAPEADAPEAGDNHGAAVSEAAQTCPTGQDAEHGKCVSEVAKSDIGKPTHPEASDDESDDDEVESDEAGEHNDEGLQKASSHGGDDSHDDEADD